MAGVVKRHDVSLIGAGQSRLPGYYDSEGNFYSVVEMGDDSPPSSSSSSAVPMDYFEDHNGKRSDQYDWWGSMWHMGSFWVWFWSLLVLVMLVLGVIGFAFSIANGNKISTLEDEVAGLLSTVTSQGQVLAQLTTPYTLSASGALVTTHVRQILNCGVTPCAMTLPTDLVSYSGLPEICVVSAAVQPHTVTIAGPAFFQPGDKLVATFAGGDVGENFCFTVTSSTTAAVTSSNGVTF